jgi:glyoxylase-like metal-dependent hydrolase (beta-lactamase superfamily II)
VPLLAEFVGAVHNLRVIATPTGHAPSHVNYIGMADGPAQSLLFPSLMELL